MEIHQFLAGASYGDAITDYALEIRRILRELGYRSLIFAENHDPKLASEVKPLSFYPEFSSKENIIIFHFSIASLASKLAYHLKEKKILIYHNITPAHFFLKFHPHLARECYHGRRELAAFVDKCEVAVGDSEFNRLELVEIGFTRTRVLPVFINFKKFNIEENRVLSRIFGDGKTNILYVGRIIPNKRVDDVIRIFSHYKHYINPNSRLILVGEYRGFERYYDYLLDLIRSLKLTDVHFTGLIPLSELVTYYRLAHIFIIMSEHEGFCLPILEAYYFGLPVIAFAAAAVPETMGGAGILVEEKDPPKIAEIVHKLVEDAEFRKKVIVDEKRVLKKHLSRDLKKELANLLNEINGR
ncbi:MAG: glycosyltransferase family 4 protein [Acidobacteria bacterium]|nr:glycosyltransferase family 4 protein [Acidobacteriota bacterium]